jgi:hypothetical protein
VKKDNAENEKKDRVASEQGWAGHPSLPRAMAFVGGFDTGGVCGPDAGIRWKRKVPLNV